MQRSGSRESIGDRLLTGASFSLAISQHLSFSRSWKEKIRQREYEGKQENYIYKTCCNGPAKGGYPSPRSTAVHNCTFPSTGWQHPARFTVHQRGRSGRHSSQSPRHAIRLKYLPYNTIVARFRDPPGSWRDGSCRILPEERQGSSAYAMACKKIRIFSTDSHFKNF